MNRSKAGAGAPRGSVDPPHSPNTDGNIMNTRASRQYGAGHGARDLRRGVLGLMALATLGTAACGDSGDDGGTVAPPGPGALQITTETVGFLQDNEYVLSVNGAVQGTIQADDQITLTDLDPDSYDVQLDDVAENCVVETSTGSSVVAVASEETAQITFTVTCAAMEPAPYSLRANRDRPNLETGVLTECAFGLCPTENEWDLYVVFNSQSDPQATLQQNTTTSVEMAIVAGKTLADLTEADVEGATFSTEPLDQPFAPDGVVLVRTDQGNTYALGNPVESTLMLTLTFDAVLIDRP